MKTFYAKTRERAGMVFDLLRPEASKRARVIFLNKVDRHITSDYSGGTGLKLVGLSSNPCVNYVEMSETDSGMDVDWMIAVSGPDGWESFDKNEASGYDVFIKALPNRERLESEVKESHFSKRKQEQKRCEE